MRRVVAILICSIMLIGLVGCMEKTETTKVPDLNKLFTMTAVMQTGDFEAEGTITRLGDKQWEIEFSAPKTLEGIKLSYNGEDIKASYMGLEFSIPKSAAPLEGILTMLFDAIDTAVTMVEMPCIEDEMTITYVGENDTGEYQIIMDKETGALIGFEVPDKNLKMEFTGFTEMTGDVSETSVTEAGEASETTAADVKIAE